MDGIASAALVLSRSPDARVDFVTNAHRAAQALRRDLGSREFIVADLGLTPELARALDQKARQGARVAYLDHHEQTLLYTPLLAPGVEQRVEVGISAAGVTARHLGIGERLEHVIAIADLVEYCTTDVKARVVARHGEERLTHEARMLDYAWRLNVADDRFRLYAARRLAERAWPSEVPEVRRRHLQVVNEGRWERALDRVRARMRVQGEVALLAFGRHKPSLLGFGSRALAAVAQEEGCRIALLVQRRNNVASVSARLLPQRDAWGLQVEAAAPRTRRLRPNVNLGRFLDAFTQEYGIAGGGHPDSAGGRIPSRHLETFIQEIGCLA